MDTVPGMLQVGHSVAGAGPRISPDRDSAACSTLPTIGRSGTRHVGSDDQGREHVTTPKVAAVVASAALTLARCSNDRPMVRVRTGLPQKHRTGGGSWGAVPTRAQGRAPAFAVVVTRAP